MERLLGKTLDELTDIALSVGLPRFAGKQLAEWIYLKRATSFMQMTNLSGKARQLLTDRYDIGRTQPKTEVVSTDGTKKYLFAVKGKSKKATDTEGPTAFVETVYIPDGDRATACVSTQAGCKMGCKFCMTGTLGFICHLTPADILNQIFSLPDSENLTNIVFMGEGEPCDNIDTVLRVLEVMTAPWGCAWSPRRITVSSVGVLPGLKKLLDSSECHIAISLHNPFAVERQAIMPIEIAYHLRDVVALLKQYDFSHQRRLSFEYICFGGINDTLRHATALRRLLSGLDCRVNLIRYHQAPANGDNTELADRLLDAKPSSEEQMVMIRDYLTQNGITTTIRKSRGEDILAACGMLVNDSQNRQ